MATGLTEEPSAVVPSATRKPEVVRGSSCRRPASRPTVQTCPHATATIKSVDWPFTDDPSASRAASCTHLPPSTIAVALEIRIHVEECMENDVMCLVAESAKSRKFTSQAFEPE